MSAPKSEGSPHNRGVDAARRPTICLRVIRLFIFDRVFCSAGPNMNLLFPFGALQTRDRSADFQSAVSPNCIRQRVGWLHASAFPKAWQSPTLRYSRVQLCATAECNSALQRGVSEILDFEISLAAASCASIKSYPMACARAGPEVSRFLERRRFPPSRCADGFFCPFGRQYCQDGLR